MLTGTPIQNDLQELFALSDFCNPGVLGTYSRLLLLEVFMIKNNKQSVSSLWCGDKTGYHIYPTLSL